MTQVRIVALVLLLFSSFGCSGSLESPRPLSADAVSKITAKFRLNPDMKIGTSVIPITPSLDIYNGTEWSITDVDVMIDTGAATRTFRFLARQYETVKNSKGEADRRLVPTFVGPLSSGDLEVDTGDFFIGIKEIKSVRVLSARGFKK
jgi:hypothetical protein